MRSFFNKPTWATPDDESNTADFYRRSKHTYGDIIAANRQQHRATTTTPDPPTDRETASSPKRRRVARLDDHSSDDSIPNSLNDDPGQRAGEDHGEKNDIVPLESPAIATPPPSNDNAPIAIASSPESTNLDDSYDANTANEKPDSPLDDRGQLIRDESHNKSQNNLTSRANSSQPLDPAKQSDSTKGHVPDEEHTPDEEDEIVPILVTSAIKNTKPLIIYRRISQRFRDVRVTWCEKQGFDNKMTSSVYLTWNKRRLFDVTTCKSLGLKGASSSVHDHSQFGVGAFPGDEAFTKDEPLRIHVEAVTDELLKSQADASLYSSFAPTKSKAENTEPSFPITLRSQDRKNICIKVRKRTKIVQIINDFRTKANVPSDTRIQLSFDGDILDPGSRVEENDIAEDDLIEVLFR